MNKSFSIGFDLDGTLWDSLKVVSESWKQTAAKAPDAVPPSDEVIKSVMGMPPRGIAMTLFPYLTEERAMELFDECTKDEIEQVAKRGGILFEGLEETLEYLSAKYPLYIVSNCQKGYIEAFLSYHNLSRYFVDKENAENTGLTKGQNIRLVMKRQGFESTVYVGDTVGDQRAAQEADVPFIFAAYGFGKAENPERTISDIRDLQKLF